MTEAISNNVNQIPMVKPKEVSYLKDKLDKVQAEQGIFGKIWNGVKEFSGIGTSNSKCESMVEKFNKGEISFEEAYKYIEDFEQKQSNMSELGKNIVTGVGAIAFTTATFGAGAAITMPIALMSGAPIGAAIKTGLGLVDRATNEVENDEFDLKLMAKDGVSGAVTGMTSAVSSGVAKGIKNASLKETIINGTKCGVECGAISGATSYLTDVALEEDKKFHFGDLTSATVTSSVISGIVGAGVGGGLYGIAAYNGNIGEVAREAAQRIADNSMLKEEIIKATVQDSASSSTRKVFGRLVRDIA